MDKVSNRIWIVLLGVAIAAIVAAMTIFWSGPTSATREAVKPGIADTKTKQSKIVQGLLHYLTKPVPPSSLRSN